MTIEEKFRQETGKGLYADVSKEMGYSTDYVNWLEKQLTLTDVSQQRELLIGFQLWEQYASNKGLTIEDYANHYLKQKGNL